MQARLLTSNRLPGWGLAVAGGCCYALANVGWGWWPLAFVCLVPLWRALADASGRSGLHGFVLGLLFGAAIYAAGFGWLFPLAGHFIDSVAGASALWLVHGVWCAVGVGRYALGGGWLLLRWGPGWASLTLPLILLEAVQVNLFPAYIGAGLVYQGQLAQLAGLGGTLLLSTLVVAINALVLRALNGRTLPRCMSTLGVAALVLALASWFGHMQLIRETPVGENRAVHVGIVQNNVVRATAGGDQSKAALDRRAHERNLYLSRQLLDARSLDLLVWPESAFGRALRRPLPLDAQMIRRDIAVPLLFGATSSFHHEGRAASANSVFLSDRQGRIEQVYDKQLLLPFAETVPGLALLGGLSGKLSGKLSSESPDALPGLVGQARIRRWLDAYQAWIARLFPWHQGFRPGPGRRALSQAGLRIATPICFEVIHPGYVRRMVRGGAANMIVTIANDAWFGDTQAPVMHLAMARLRAIEHGLWVVRATNSGISAFIDPRGGVVAQTPLFREAAVSATVYGGTAATLYARYGNWVAYAAGLALLLVLALPAAPLREEALGAQR